MTQSKLLCLPSKTWTITGCFAEAVTHRIKCVLVGVKDTYQVRVRDGMKSRNYVKKWVCTCVREQKVYVHVCVHKTDTELQSQR